jgi:hypothetical protein
MEGKNQKKYQVMIEHKCVDTHLSIPIEKLPRTDNALAIDRRSARHRNT